MESCCRGRGRRRGRRSRLLVNRMTSKPDYTYTLDNVLKVMFDIGTHIARSLTVLVDAVKMRNRKLIEQKIEKGKPRSNSVVLQVVPDEVFRVSRRLDRCHLTLDHDIQKLNAEKHSHFERNLVFRPGTADALNDFKEAFAVSNKTIVTIRSSMQRTEDQYLLQKIEKRLLRAMFRLAARCMDNQDIVTDLSPRYLVLRKCVPLLPLILDTARSALMAKELLRRLNNIKPTEFTCRMVLQSLPFAGSLCSSLNTSVSTNIIHQTKSRDDVRGMIENYYSRRKQREKTPPPEKKAKRDRSDKEAETAVEHVSSERCSPSSLPTQSDDTTETRSHFNEKPGKKKNAVMNFFSCPRQKPKSLSDISKNDKDEAERQATEADAANLDLSDQDSEQSVSSEIPTSEKSKETHENETPSTAQRKNSKWRIYRPLHNIS